MFTVPTETFMINVLSNNRITELFKKEEEVFNVYTHPKKTESPLFSLCLFFPLPFVVLFGYGFPSTANFNCQFQPHL